jgi:hypothetical protein
MRRIAFSALALLWGAGVASAAPLSLPGPAPIYIQFNNLEQVNAANNLVVPGYAPAAGTQGNWGVLNVTSVQRGAVVGAPGNDISGGPAFFFDDGPGGGQGQITGIFYGIQITGATTANGGFVDLFWHDAGADTITADCIAGNTCLPNAAGVAQFTSGTFLARIAFASGIDPLNAGTFIKSNTDPATQGGSGHADSFGNIVSGAGGAWSGILNGDWFTTAFGTRDIRFSNFFNVDVTNWNGPNGTVGLRSNDPARAFTVPEPASMTLLGLGLGLAGLMSRRRAKV